MSFCCAEEANILSTISSACFLSAVIEQGEEVGEVHVGVGEDAREDDVVLWVHHRAPGARRMVRSRWGERKRRTSMAAGAAAWNGVIACAYGVYVTTVSSGRNES